jgi:polar amino acid transport system permease protein
MSGVLEVFRFDLVWRYLPALLNGLATNLLLTLLGFLCGGVVLGTLLALANLSPARWLRWPAFAFVEFWRSTPLLVQAIWMHFAFPALTGFATTPFQSALLALVFNVSAYTSEIIRAGILGVPKGQYEAARALGLKPAAVWGRVILPQALRLVIPPLIGTIISIFKATAILQILAINDLMRAAARISSHTFHPVEIYTAAAVLAAAAGLLISLAGARLERLVKRELR